MYHLFFHQYSQVVLTALPMLQLKKRLRTIAQSALNIYSDDESDYGHESASRLGQTQNSAFDFGPNAAVTPTPQSESECHSESTPSFKRSFFSQRSRSYRNSHNLHNIEALRSDMLSKPHGFYLDSDCDEYDWCEENRSSSTDVSFFILLSFLPFLVSHFSTCILGC
jgi:hypothetical protein